MKTTNRKKFTDLSAMVYAKIPPQAKDLEEAVLGAIMLEKSAFDTVAEILKPECFYVDANHQVFRAIQKLQQKNIPIDILTVVEELKSHGELEKIGGPYFVTRLTNTVVSSANIEAHARIIQQKFIQRELIRISGEIIKDSYEDSTDVFDLLSLADKQFSNLITGTASGPTPVSQNLITAVSRIAKLKTEDRHITGVPAGFTNLDSITHGWQTTDLIILAARPSVGKTAFALNLARNAAMDIQNPTCVAFFSLEMSKTQLMNRLISAETLIPLERLSNGQITDDEFKQLHGKPIQKLMDSKIFIDDTAAINIFQLRSKCRKLKNKNNIGLIVIDYLQLMSGTNERNTSREQEISAISRNLKALAKELQLPIIALSQLNRALESRAGSKMPQLSDLRESGAIEQDADMVMFLYRPEYHGEHTTELGESTKGETYLRIAKHRNGKLDTLQFEAQLWNQRFIPAETNTYKSPAIAKEKKWEPLSVTKVDEAPF